jgi:orotate phosphoribosyltransferase
MSELDDIRNKLRVLLASRAYLEGDFVLTSGKRSSHYFDCKQVTLHPEGLMLASELLVMKLHDASIPAIGGLAIGADPVVAGAVASSIKLGYPVLGFIVRKEPKAHGTKSWIEGPVEPGTRVAIVDDVVTSGGSIIAAVKNARAEGLEPVAAYALVDREEGGAKRIERECGLPFESLFRYSELVKPSGDG